MSRNKPGDEEIKPQSLNKRKSFEGGKGIQKHYPVTLHTRYPSEKKKDPPKKILKFSGHEITLQNMFSEFISRNTQGKTDSGKKKKKTQKNIWQCRVQFNVWESNWKKIFI